MLVPRVGSVMNRSYGEGGGLQLLLRSSGVDADELAAAEEI